MSSGHDDLREALIKILREALFTQEEAEELVDGGLQTGNAEPAKVEEVAALLRAAQAPNAAELGAHMIAAGYSRPRAVVAIRQALGPALRMTAQGAARLQATAAADAMVRLIYARLALNRRRAH